MNGHFMKVINYMNLKKNNDYWGFTNTPLARSFSPIIEKKASLLYLLLMF